jgi:DNA repair exonuclease SbcCD ATPase subunit
MYAAANSIYRKIEGHASEYIQIESGLRDTTRQSELYECYLHSLYGGPPANKANKPGKSFHEYGLAIDVIRNGDEIRLKKALMDAGWNPAIADEGWHFQAEAASDWEDIKNKISTIVEPVSEKYAQNRVVYYENKKRILEAEPGYLSERIKLNESKAILNSKLADLNQEKYHLNREQSLLRDEDFAIKNERQRIQRLKSQIDSMVYDKCPQGNPYDTCTHEDLKRQFDRDRNELKARYQKAAKELGGREQRHADAWKKWNTETTQYRTKLGSYQNELQEYEQDRVKHDALGKRIDVWRREMNTRDSMRQNDLNEIAAAVGKLTPTVAS